MYASPVVTPASGAPAVKRTAVPMIASVTCLGVVLFLISAAIVMALIPIYISSRAVAASSSAQRSKEITIISEGDQVGARNSDRRRRATDDLLPYAGADFGDAGKKQAQDKLLASVTDKNVAGVEVSKVSIALADPATKKRYALYKRASTQVPVVIIRFFIKFASGCGFICQTVNGPLFRTKLMRDAPGYSFSNVLLLKNGVSLGTLARIRLTTLRFISEIIPGLSSATQASSPATVTAASNSTTAVTATTTAAPTPPIAG